MNTKLSFFFFAVLLTAILLPSCGSEADDPVANENPGVVVSDPTLASLSEKIADDPENASLYAQRGAAYYEKEGYDEAIADLEKAISLDSSKVEYYHLLADVNLDYFKSRRALNVLRDASRRFPGDMRTLLKLSEYQLILRLHQDALATLDSIRVRQPLSADMFLMRGLVFQDMADTAKAINNFQSAVENNPDLIEGWINLGRLWSGENADFAERFFDNAIRRDTANIDALHAKAVFLSNVRNDLDGSLNLYRRIIELQPQYEDAYYNSGLLYLDMQQPEEAYAQFDLAVQMNPGFTAAYFYRGVSAQLLGNISQARNDYQQTLNLEPQFERAQEALDALPQ